MFAGEGDPFRTNRRFHDPAARLSTAFDSVTLYGRDPSERPDVYGKGGTSGVSIATLDDMKALYDGFDLCDPTRARTLASSPPSSRCGAWRRPGVVHRPRRPQLLLRLDLRLPRRRSGGPHLPARVTLANGFTYVEAYLARGIDIDDFAPNFSFFFSNGMNAEYTVMGRVARRIWATAMRERYGASGRAAKLKYHVQTSGRSLHAQEMDFNDIRTTLQALCAIYDNANSLHTNAYDEAVTTPTESSVRRALAIQMIIDQEWGLAINENPLQGAIIVEELTDLVEQAVLAEFDRISNRGGVLGAMETGYQRGRIQDESMLYEHRKHDVPIIGVNTFLRDHTDHDETPLKLELARASEDEKASQLRRVSEFKQRHAEQTEAQLARLQQAATGGDNVFACLWTPSATAPSARSPTRFEVGGQYRRNV